MRTNYVKTPQNNTHAPYHPQPAPTSTLSHPPAPFHHNKINQCQSYKAITAHYSRIMRAIQCVLLTVAVAFLVAVNGATLQQIPFFVSMAEGDRVEIAEHGPFTFSAACDSSAVTLDVLVEATQEDYIFTDYTSPFNLMAGNTTFCPGVFSETSYGNDYADGGFVSASGYYIGWDGESVIGLHLANGATQPTLGDDVNCVVSGVVKLIEKS